MNDQANLPDIEKCPNKKCMFPDTCIVLPAFDIQPESSQLMFQYVLCQKCGYRGPMEGTPLEAIEAHNWISERSDIIRLSCEQYRILTSKCDQYKEALNKIKDQGAMDLINYPDKTLAIIVAALEESD